MKPSSSKDIKKVMTMISSNGIMAVFLIKSCGLAIFSAGFNLTTTCS
jgi:hypothetical protein